MGVDGDLTSIIREIVQFLESLCDVDLPLKIENARANLLQRSKTKLSTISLIARGSTSPEPYLDMNAGKGLLLFPKKKNQDVEIEEYVGVEEQPDSSATTSSHQDYYESFQEINGINDGPGNGAEESPGRSKSWRKLPPRDEQVENKLRDIYRTFTATKTSSKAHKSGPLYHKVERKPFGFVRGNVRLCWIGIVGSHLLIHGSEDDKQPPEVCSIRGYSARPAPSSVSRDPERAKSAFEIFCPGNKTLQFIARSPMEMEEWLAAISRMSTIAQQDGDENSEEENVAEKRSEDCQSMEEKYQDVGEVISTSRLKDSSILPSANQSLESDCKKFDTTRNSIILPTASPPILPVRMIPRRLPSLPSEEITPVASYEPLDDGGYEEDDIYHKIEDFRDNVRSYENVKKSKKVKKLTKNKKRKRKQEILETETYDDVANKDLTKKREENSETYDDVRSIVYDTQTSNLGDNNSARARKNVSESLEKASTIQDQSLQSYDDVLQSSASSRVNNSCRKTKDSKQTKTEKSPTKSPQKRSFLDRVRHRKDSPKKEEKKRSKESPNDKKSEKKEKTTFSSESPETREAQVSCGPDLDLPTYDDVSELVVDSTNYQNENHRTARFSIQIDETSNYNCPPPPRPIYSKPPSPIVVQTVKSDVEALIDQVYDDIGNYRDEAREEVVSSDVNEGYLQESIFKDNVSSKDAENEMEKELINNCNAGNIYSIGAGARISIFDEEKKNAPQSEHYQTPRADTVKVNRAVVEGHEQLYDDIAILADFRAKQRDSSSTSPKKSSSITNGTEKPTTTAAIGTRKPWNRFGSCKKISSRDSSLPQTSSSMRNKSLLDLDDARVDNTGLPVGEKHEGIKLNKLQKLINKMESTLGKQPSTKSVTPIFNKSHNGE